MAEFEDEFNTEEVSDDTTIHKPSKRLHKGPSKYDDFI